MQRRESLSVTINKIPKSSYRHTKKEKQLFAYLMQEYGLKNDKALADFLYTSQPVISQVRNDSRSFSHRLILVTYDKTNLSIEDIRRMAKEDC